MDVNGSLAAKWSIDVAVGREGGAKEGGRSVVRQVKFGRAVSLQETAFMCGCRPVRLEVAA